MTVFSTTEEAGDHEGQADGGQRIRIDQRVHIGIPALGEGLREDIGQRQHDEQADEADGNGDDGPFHQRRLFAGAGMHRWAQRGDRLDERRRLARKGQGLGRRENLAHADLPVRDCDQRCRRLMRNSNAKEATSMAQAMVVASA